MDSGNSGSLQSSSGGDEDFDTRTESISPFFNPTGHLHPISNPQPPPPFHHHQSTFSDPPFHNLSSFSSSHPPTNPNSNPQFNLDSIWPRPPRPDPNYTQFATHPNLSSSSSGFLGGQGVKQYQFAGQSSMALPPLDEMPKRSAASQSDQSNAAKASKKRTRASRRAPTTVLTTDTSNFRQMVQEFTGIPSPPFSASSPYSRRLDLFPSGSSSMRSGSCHESVLGSLFPLMSSVQKIQTSSSSSSSWSPSLLNSAMVEANSIAANSTNNHHHHPNMENPVLNFQSLLQSPFHQPIKYPSTDPHPHVFGSKSSSFPSIHELGTVGQEHQNPRAKMFSTDGHGRPRSNQGVDQYQDYFGGNPNPHHGGSDHSFTLDFHPDKGLENVSSRSGEATTGMGSWVCPPE